MKSAYQFREFILFAGLALASVGPPCFDIWIRPFKRGFH
jgi:hypothetical protein